MDLNALRSEWLRVYHTAPPRRLSRDLLTRGIADKLQEAAYGGLRPAQRRRLANLIQDATGAAVLSVSAADTLRPGAMLVRTWRGQTHTVTVLPDGYEHLGQRFASLSQIATSITGAHWSGPRFFGLTADGRMTKPAHEAA